MLSTVIIAVLSATTMAALPAETLQPWEITTLHTHSPSGRPGNDPHRTINVTIHDPNTLKIAQNATGDAVFPPAIANCSAQWLDSGVDVLYNVELPCIAIATEEESPSYYGNWSMTVLPGSGEGGDSPTNDFGLEFKLIESTTVLGESYERKFVGKDQFRVGVNLAGECGGSGVCNWALSTTPYAINQTEVK